MVRPIMKKSKDPKSWHYRGVKRRDERHTKQEDKQVDYGKRPKPSKPWLVESKYTGKEDSFFFTFFKNRRGWSSFGNYRTKRSAEQAVAAHKKQDIYKDDYEFRIRKKK
jgi:hypothetical protein